MNRNAFGNLRLQGVPLGLGARKVDVGQGGTFVKNTVFQRLKAGGEIDLGQGGASAEGAGLDLLYLIGDCEGCQRGTILKGVHPNRDQIFGESEVDQGGAACEG